MKQIMIQGTMSNVGKTVLVSALCRMFLQDGYRVCPFKAQNMTSFVTALPDGRLMNTAQILQAKAAGREADVRMNPVLLRPKTDTGSEVIVNGVPEGEMNAAAYTACKRTLFPKVLEAYQALSETCDIMVIEGAGSPAEINLKENDIVNMGFAEAVRAPVLLVGDINLGGVFAQLYGTIALLEEEEKALVKGLVINKFRGDRALLEPGIAAIEELCGQKVLGVLPFTAVDLPGEDSLSAGNSEDRGSTFAGGILSAVNEAKAVDFSGESNGANRTEQAFDMLADLLRQNMNTDALYRILEEGA